MESLKRSGSMSAFWRALALPFRGGGGGGGGGAAPSRAPRGSLDELGPSCSLGADAPREGPPSPSSGGADSGGEEAGAEACAAAVAAALAADAPAERTQPQPAPQPEAPPVPPPADARPRRKRPPVALNARGSEAALRSTNPIRKVVDAVGEVPALADKPLISLAIGDPTAYGARAPAAAADALATAATSGLFDGYAHSAGLAECRAAVAAYHAARLPPAARPLSAADVLMTHGASQALSLALGAVANPGANVLLPRPGFPLYQTLCEYYGLEYRHYDLLPERNWEADLGHIASLADSRTAAIVVCNPSNPTGAVFSAQHLRELLGAAAAAGAVVIADEVYADIVWGTDGVRFVPMAALSDDVPILSVGALSKRFLVPGWRCGWLLVHDRHRALASAGIVEALSRLVQISIGPTVPVQASVPHLLSNTPRAWHDAQCGAYAAAAALCCTRATSAPGLGVDCVPCGAMYLLLRISLPDFPAFSGGDDVAWAAALQREEAVLLLPGSAFGAPGRVRLVLCAPLHVLEAAWDRIDAFVGRHHVGCHVSGGARANGAAKVLANGAHF